MRTSPSLSSLGMAIGLVVAFFNAFAVGAPLESPSAFVKLDQLTQADRLRLQPAVDASFHLHLDSGLDCTGTFISNSGHFITARHCITGCLLRHGAVSRTLAIDDPTRTVKITRNSTGTQSVHRFYTYRMTVEDDKLDDGLLCPGTINDRHLQIRLLLTGGRGWLSPSNSLASFSKLYPDEYRELLDQGYEHKGDFAVLQVVDFKSNACLPLATKSASVGQTLHAISYPCLNRESLFTRGTTALVTSGSKTDGFRQSDFFKFLGPQKIPFDVGSVERKETFFSSLDMEKCGSGTAIIDEKQDIVGVATRVYKNSTDYEFGSLESVDAVQILKDLREKRAPDFSEITACRSK